MSGIWLIQRCINVQQCTSIYIKGLFFLEFGLEGIDSGSHLCIQIETIPETGPTIRRGFFAIAISILIPYTCALYLDTVSKSQVVCSAMPGQQ